MTDGPFLCVNMSKCAFNPKKKNPCWCSQHPDIKIYRRRAVADAAIGDSAGADAANGDSAGADVNRSRLTKHCKTL